MYNYQEEREPWGKRNAKDNFSGQVGEKPKVYIERHVWNKMFGLCKAATSEVSGYAMGEYKDGYFRVYDFYFPKQQCSSAYTDMDDDAVDKLKYKLWKKKKNMSHFRVWIHTHYNFSTFWSGTDDNTAERLVKATFDGNSKELAWGLSIVINQAGNWLARADFMGPLNNGTDVTYKMTLDELPVYLIPNKTRQKRWRYKDMIKKWVRPLGVTNPCNTAIQTPTDKAIQDNQALWKQHWEREFGFQDEYPETKPVKKHWWDYQKDKECKKYIPWTLGKDGKWHQEGNKEPESGLEGVKSKVAETDMKMGTKYVIHGGKLMTLEDYNKAKFCACAHVGSWEECMCDQNCDLCLDRLSLDFVH